MTYASYRLTDDDYIPTYVMLDGREAPVWRQARWDTGEYREFIVKNGCGHCCAAMALSLHGVTLDPHGEFSLCRTLWGEPNDKEGNWQSASGIAKILGYHGVAAACFGVADRDHAAAHIDEALRAGKQVIFWSQPSPDFPENPFSKNAHYVMAVGYTEGGEILIANSSEKAASLGVQTVDIDTVRRALFEGADPIDATWGLHDLPRSGGYVVVG